LENCQERKGTYPGGANKIEKNSVTPNSPDFKKEEVMWSQRVRVNWVKQGSHYGFFHKTASMKNRK